MTNELENINKGYQGDFILVSRMDKFFPFIGWNGNEITEQDIKNAIKSGIPEQSKVFGGLNDWDKIKKRSDSWHIARVIYFVNHPEEIRNIQIDNVCEGMTICPIPIIIDGNHRFMAAKYLKLEKVHCMYGGRSDVLDFLIGICGEIPEE